MGWEGTAGWRHGFWPRQLFHPAGIPVPSEPHAILGAGSSVLQPLIPGREGSRVLAQNAEQAMERPLPGGRGG